MLSQFRHVLSVSQCVHCIHSSLKYWLYYPISRIFRILHPISILSIFGSVIAFLVGMYSCSKLYFCSAYLTYSKSTLSYSFRCVCTHYAIIGPFPSLSSVLIQMRWSYQPDSLFRINRVYSWTKKSFSLGNIFLISHTFNISMYNSLRLMCDINRVQWKRAGVLSSKAVDKQLLLSCPFPNKRISAQVSMGTIAKHVIVKVASPSIFLQPYNNKVLWESNPSTFQHSAKRKQLE